MIQFAKRNLKLFFRDKTSVFFSLLSVFIILGLYIFFLGDQMIESVEKENVLAGGRLMDNWIMAGILAVIPVCTTLGSFGIIVNDKAKKIDKDFRCAPIKARSLVGGHLLGATCIGTIMSLFALVLIEIYFACKGYPMLSALGFLEIFGTMILTVLISTSMMYMVVSLFSSHNAFTTVGTIIGTLIGFLTGIYLPIGSTAEPIQYVIKFFPISHSASLYRKILMEDPLKESFKMAPGNAVNDFKLDMGVEFNAFGHTFTSVESIAYLLITTLLFCVISLLIVKKKAK